MRRTGGRSLRQARRREHADGELGHTYDAFTANWTYSWGDTKYSYAEIGTSVGRTCYLSGIGDHFRPKGAYLFSGGTSPSSAGVRKNASGNYEIFVNPESGRHLIAYVRCVNSAAGRIEVSWSSGSQNSYGDKVIGTSSGRKCFLTEIKNDTVAIKDSNGAIYSYGWAFDDNNNPDEVRVFSDGSYWKLAVRPGVHTYPVSIYAKAVCININQALGTWTWKAAEGGTAQIQLTNVSGATCGLEGIRGHFNASLGDWADSVHVSNVADQFYLNMKNGKRGWASCMK